MKKHLVSKRMLSMMTAVLMVCCLIVSALPASAAGMTADFSIFPSEIHAGDSISASVVIRNENLKNSTVDVSIEGIGSVQCSWIQEDVAFSSEGTASLRIPVGNITYGGSSSEGGLRIWAGDYTVQYQIATLIPNETNTDPEPPAAETGNVLSIQPGSPIPVIEAGKTMEISYPLTASKRIYNDVEITAKLPDRVYFTSAAPAQKMTFGRNETKNYKIKVSADSALESGTYPLTLNLQYKAGSQLKTETLETYVKVSGTSTVEKNSDLEVVNYTVSPATVQAGANFSLNVTVENKGDKASAATVVSLGGSAMSTDSFTMNRTLDHMDLPALQPGQKKTLTFALCSNSKMTTGNYILDVTVGEAEGASSSKVFVPVQENAEVQQEEAKNESVPQLIVMDYTYGEEPSVTGGQVFTLSANIRNTGKIPVKNVKITISSAADAETGGAFSPANSSNTFYVESIPAGGTITQTIDLLPKADARPKSYGVDLDFSYEAIVNDSLIEKSLTQTIAIPLAQPDRFEVGELQMWGPVMVGETLGGYVSYVNKGKSTIFNLSVKVEGEGFTTAESESYIGNVDSGSGDSYELALNTSEAGTIAGKLIFSYEDANGEVKEIVKEFENEVIANEPFDPGIVEPDLPVEAPEEGGMPVWGWIAIIGGGVVVLIVIGVVTAKMIKKKKQAALDLEDDYDDEDGAQK